MCNSVIAEGVVYETPWDLAKLVGGQEKLVWQDSNPFVNWRAGEDWHRMDLCLCPINLEATLEGTRLRWRRGDVPMEYFIEEM